MVPKNLGLKVVDPPEPNWIATHGAPNIDVVAIHGLNGDRLETWTHRPSGTLWLRDLLPQKLPRARVMTFGYNADIFANTSIAGIRDNARKLMGALRDKREEEDEEGEEVDNGRPIVFVAHSLGGIIVKQALRIANDDPQYSALARCAKGILFFGTPHRGSDAAKWANLGASIAAFALGKHKSELVKTLTNNSRDLLDVSEDFRNLAERYAIVSFYEEDVWPKYESVIVEKHSALMEVPHEEGLLMGGNHSSMCKFEKGDDEERFDAVWKRIRRAAKGPKR